MKSLTLAVIGLIAAGVGVSRAPAAELDEAPGQVVQLAPFQVKNSRPWLYAAIPGYEVLSVENEKSTRRIADELQRAGRFVPLFFPDGTVPSPSVPAIFFIDRYAQDGNLAEAQKKVGANSKIGAFTLGSAGATIQFASSSVVAGWIAGRTSPAGQRIYAAALIRRPPMPSWYGTGLSSLLGAAKIYETKMVFDDHRWSVPDLIPVADLMALRTQAQLNAFRSKSASANKSVVETATLFIRWGFFSDSGRRRASFIDFAATGATGDDGTLQRYFAMNAADLRLSMLAYAAKEAGKTASIDLTAKLAAAKLEPVDVRPATETEVARLVGHSYVSLGVMATSAEVKARYQTMARDVLAGTYGNLLEDPNIQATMGYLEFVDRHNDKAREYVNAAVTGGVKTPNVYFLQATLRMDEAGLRVGDQKPISVEQLKRVIEPLLAAFTMAPWSLDAYNLLADLRLRASEPVAESELDLHAMGTREYPGAVGLAARVARLLARNGRTDQAGEIIARALALPPTIQMATARAAVVRLKEELDTPQAGQLALPASPLPTPTEF